MKIDRTFVGRFVRFAIVGMSGAVVDYGVLALLIEVFGWPSLVANAISFTLAASWNYMLNRVWTFGSKEKKVAQEYAKFIGVSVVGLGISTLTLYLLERFVPTWSNASGNGFEVCGIFIKYFYILKFVSIVVTMIWNFFANYLYTFRKTTKKQAI